MLLKIVFESLVIFLWVFFSEIKSVAALLGISGVTLYRSLTSRSHKAKNNVFKAALDPTTVSIYLIVVI